MNGADTARARGLAAGLVTGLTGLALVGAARVRSGYLRWGATGEETASALPGDDLLPSPDLVATRAVDVGSPAGEVWPWVAQLGYGRGGFYSYDALENLVGVDIHSADRIVSQWQSTAVGSFVHLAPGVGLRVAATEPGRALVLRGAVPVPGVDPPYDFTWSFVLHDAPGGCTRLLVRERYAYLSWWAPLLVEPVEVLSAVMSRRMLHGIRDRVQRSGAVPA